MVVASQLSANIAIQGATQAQAAFSSMSTGSKKTQADLSQLQAVAQDVSNVVQNKFAQALRSSQGPLQQLAKEAADAGIDTSKLAELQAKAAVAADNLAIAQDRAAAALQKAANITIDAASSEAQITAAQNQASLAADKVATAESAAAAAMNKVGIEAKSVSTAMAESEAKTATFGAATAEAGASTGGFLSGIKGAAGGLLDFGMKASMTLMGVEMLGGMFAKLTTAAGDMIGGFQQQMTKLTTTAGESTDKIKMVGNGILAMAGPTATSVKDLGAAMYFVEGGGAHGAAALTDLKIAAMGAKTENADLTGVTKALMFTLANYADTGLTAAGAMNTLITAVGESNMTLQDMSGAISNVMPTAHAFGISLADVTAGLATMVMKGDDASAAATHLSMMIKTLEAPASSGAKALASIGLTTQQVTDEMRKSLPGALELIVDHLKKKFPEGSTAYNEALKNISGGSRSMQAILETTGSSLDTFKQNVDKITGAVKAGGNSIAGWNDVTQNFNFMVQQATAGAGAFAVAIGTALAPMFSSMIGSITGGVMPALNNFGQWIISVGIPKLQAFGASIAPLGFAIQDLGKWFVLSLASIGPILEQVGHEFAVVFGNIAKYIGESDQFGNFIADIETLGNQILRLDLSNLRALGPLIQGALGLLGSLLTGIVIPAIDLFVFNLGKMGEFLNSGSLAANAVRGALLGIAGALALMKFSDFLEALPFLQAGFYEWAAAAWTAAAGTIAATWPILAIGAAIGIAAAAFLYFYNTNAGFKDFIGQIGLAMQNLWSFIKTAFTPVWLELQDVWKNQMQPALAGLGASFQQLWIALQPMMPGLKLLGEIIGGILLAAIVLIVGEIGGMIGALAGLMRGVAEIIGGVVQIVSGFVQTIAGIVTFIVDLFTGHFDRLGGDMKTILGGIGEIFSGFGTILKGIVDGIIGSITGGFKGMATTVIGTLDGMVNGVQDKTKQAKDAADINSLQMKLKVVNNAIATDNETIAKFDHMRQGIIDQIQQTKDGAEKKSLEIKLTMVTHAEETAIAVKDKHVKMRTDTESELDKLKTSISTKSAGIMGDISHFFGGIGAWFHDRWDAVAKSSDDLRTAIRTKIGDAWNDVVHFFGGIGKWFGDRWNDVLASTKPFRDYMGAVFETIGRIVHAIFDKLGDYFHDKWVAFASGSDWLRNYIRGKIGDLWNDIVAKFSSLGKMFQGWYNDVANASDWLRGVIRGKIGDAWNYIVTVFTPLGKTFQGWWDAVAKGSDNLRNYLRGKIGDAWNDIVAKFSPIGKWFEDRWTEIKTNVSNKWNEMKTDTGNIFKGMINLIIDQLNTGISVIEQFINFFGKGLDDVAAALGTTGTVPQNVHLGRIAHYAEGTTDGGHPGGPAIVGEKGREMVFLPKGATVASNDITEMLLAMTGGKIPGYAGGVGDIGSKIMDWVAGGAKSILDNMVSDMHITAPNLLGMPNIAKGVFNTIEKWALSWIEKILPAFTASTAGGHAVNTPGNVASWIATAMGLTHVPATWAADLGTIAMKESGGNPNAINRTDSNAIAGHPSQGLFQMIPSTFAAHMLPGHTNILDPISNAASAIEYIIGRYGDVFHVPGIIAMSKGQNYVGYANGGIINEPISGVGLNTGKNYAFGEGGKQEMVLPYIPSGVNLAQSSHAPANITIIVQPNDLNVDGRRLARVLEPHRVDIVRQHTGAKI